MEHHIVFGTAIIENLTTGMYKDPMIIYREYIQNACDQIDKAVAEGILNKNEGVVDIDIDEDVDKISIKDNATGIPSAEFERTLADIANSDKKMGENKGFRGIGRLAGLAYCDKLIFTSSAKGEKTVSKMICDAALLQKLIEEDYNKKKHNAIEVLQQVFSFSYEDTAKKDEHFFKVELIDIKLADLLNKEAIKEWLSFVAPVPYKSTFYHRTTIYDYVKKNNYKLDEYNIKINGEDIFKNYGLNFSVQNGDDSINDIKFHEFYNSNNELLGWMWLGITGFMGAIPESCKMRCIRLRKENIQIGEEDALKNFFKETRGYTYFIGELFATHKDLIPNAQRDYFNANETMNEFKKVVEKYFRDELSKIYRNGSEVNASLKKMKAYEKASIEFKEKEQNNDFINANDKEKAKEKLDMLEKQSDEAEKKLLKLINAKSELGNDSDKVTSIFAQKRYNQYKSDQTEKKLENIDKPSSNNEKEDKKYSPMGRIKRFRDKGYSRDTCKLINKIYNSIKKFINSKKPKEKVTVEEIFEAIERDVL